METFSALLALCAGNSPVSGVFPSQRPVTRNFDVFFELCPNKRLSKQWWGWWFETQSRSLWRHCNDTVHMYVQDNEKYAWLAPWCVLCSFDIVFYPPSLHWQWGSHVIAQMPRDQPQRILSNKSYESQRMMIWSQQINSQQKVAYCRRYSIYHLIRVPDHIWVVVATIVTYMYVICLPGSGSWTTSSLVIYIPF